MGFFSHLSCFGGQKNRRVKPSEPARRASVQAQEEKNDSLPRIASDEANVVEEPAENGATEPRAKSEDTVITSTPQTLWKGPSLSEATTAPEALTNTENPAVTTTPRPASHNSPPSCGAPPAPLPSPSGSVGSSPSKCSSRGYSLKQVSTKATTPPQTPARTEAKPVRTTHEDWPRKEGTGEKTDNTAGRTPGADLDPDAVDAPLSQDHHHPTQHTNLKALEASTKPLLALRTTSPATAPRMPRPSYEDDTPVSPPEPMISSQSHPARRSTAPTSPSFPNTTPQCQAKSPPPREKGGSRLSLARFLSIRSASRSRTRREPRQQEQPQRPEIEAVAKEINPPMLAEVETEDPRAHSTWEKEIEVEVGRGEKVTKVEGRKWTDEGDNESLFCY